MSDYVPLIITAVVFFTGILTYYKQKEYELVQQRYLVDCVDQLCSNIDYSLGLFRNNWARSLQLFKRFRDTEQLLTKDDCNINLIPFDYNSSKIVPFYRLKHLINDNVYYELTQKIWVFVEISYSFFDSDFKKAITHYIGSNRKSEAKKKEILTAYYDDIISYENKSKKYYTILTTLMNISSILEKEKFSFKKINSFRNRADVKKIISELKIEFELK